MGKQQRLLAKYYFLASITFYKEKNIMKSHIIFYDNDATNLSFSSIANNNSIYSNNNILVE